MLYFEFEGEVITIDPEQRELVVGQTYAFKNSVDGTVWLGRVDTVADPLTRTGSYDR
jgi:hypothetical protein